MCEYLKEILGMQVDKCEVSSRLTKAPCALVQPQWGVSPQMQRFMRAQAAAAGTEPQPQPRTRTRTRTLNPTLTLTLTLTRTRS